MNMTRTFLSGALLGAGAMYFLDPRLGKRRRVLLQDQMRRISREASEGLETGLRDLKNRGQGLMHDANSLVHFDTGRISTRGRFKWSPGPRLLAAPVGAALMANCLASRTPTAMALGALGFGLLGRSLSGKSDVHIERTLEINAPVEQVFEFFANPENYLRISDTITNVELMGEGRFAKNISMGGIPVRFEERFTSFQKNDHLETHSTDASPIRYSKQMRFESMDDHHTRLHIHFCYSPPGGELGHAVAGILGLDAQSLLTNLLMRAKNFLETGREPHDATAHRKQQSHGHNGSHKSEDKLRGSGVPHGDVQRFSLREQETTPWPRSAETDTAPRVGIASPFPPAID